MYRAYAQDPQARVNVGIRRRLAPLLGNDRKLIEMMNGLLFSMPGTPIIYYGDEIGMGDNIYLGDRNAVRTPMQWNSDRNAGFSDGQPAAALPPGHHRSRVPLPGGQRRGPGAEPELAAVVDEAAHRACASATRPSAGAPSRSCGPTTARSSPSSAASGTSASWCVVNLSRNVQCVELDLSEFRGAVPVELFGNLEFPPVGDLPYFITLGPHGFYWFSLECEPERAPPRGPPSRSPAVGRRSSTGSAPAGLRSRSCRPTWPSGAGSARRPGPSPRPSIIDAVPIPCRRWATARERPGPLAAVAAMLIVQVEIDHGSPERYTLAVAFTATAPRPRR